MTAVPGTIAKGLSPAPRPQTPPTPAQPRPGSHAHPLRLRPPEPVFVFTRDRPESDDLGLASETPRGSGTGRGKQTRPEDTRHGPSALGVRKPGRGGAVYAKGWGLGCHTLMAKRMRQSKNIPELQLLSNFFTKCLWKQGGQLRVDCVSDDTGVALPGGSGPAAPRRRRAWYSGETVQAQVLRERMGRRRQSKSIFSKTKQ